MKKIIILALCAASFAIAAPKNALALLIQLTMGVGYIRMAMAFIPTKTK